MRFKGLDLNLLVALDALLETRSVSAAARRVNLSQPAMSAALARLRDYFDDDLLVAHGKRMMPTAHAELLAPRLKTQLRGLEGLLTSSAGFEPASATRTFSIIATDYIAAVALAPLMAELATEAPGLGLEILSPHDDSAELLAQGKVDLLITPDAFVHPDHPVELLFEERQVLVGWSGNPLFQRGFTEADVFACGHVAVSFGRQRTASFADRQLALQGKARRIEATAPTFMAVPWFLRGTGRVAFMHERLARAMAETFPIAIAEIPFDFPAMREMVQHHRSRGDDEGLAWLRRRIAEAANPSVGQMDIDPDNKVYR